MATLGDILGSARRDAASFMGWIGTADPDLADGLNAAAKRLALDPAAFVRMAMRDFSRLASEEDWATLISGMRESVDPGMTCLSAMVQWRMSAAGCEQHDWSTRQGVTQ